MGDRLPDPGHRGGGVVRGIPVERLDAQVGRRHEIIAAERLGWDIVKTSLHDREAGGRRGEADRPDVLSRQVEDPVEVRDPLGRGDGHLGPVEQFHRLPGRVAGGRPREARGVRLGVALQSAALVPVAPDRREVRAAPGRHIVTRVEHWHELLESGPVGEVLLQRGLLDLPEGPDVDLHDRAHAQPVPLGGHHLRGVGGKIRGEAEEPRHARAVRKRAEALAVAPAQAKAVEQRAGLRRIIRGEGVELAGVGVGRVGTRGVLGGFADAVVDRVNDRAAVDGQRERLPEGFLIQQPVLPGRLGVRRIHRPVQVRADLPHRARGAVPMQQAVALPRRLGREQRVVLEVEAALLHRGLAPGHSGGDEGLVAHIHDHAVEVGQLAAGGINREVIRVADEGLRRGRLVVTVDPRPHARVLGVEPVLHPDVHRERARQVHRLHQPGDQRRVAEGGVKFPQVVGGTEILDGSGEPLEEHAVGLLEPEPHGQCVHLLNGSEFAGLAHEGVVGAAGGEGVALEIEHLPFPPEQDVVGGERMAVGPAQALAQGKGPHTLVGRHGPGLREVRHDRVTLRRPADERGVGEPRVEDALDVLGAGGEPVPGAAVAAQALDTLEHDRLRAGAFGDRREFSRADQFVQDRGLRLRPPGAAGAGGVVHVAPDHRRVRRVQPGLAREPGRRRLGRGRHRGPAGKIRAEECRRGVDERRQRERRRGQAQEEPGGENQAAGKGGHDGSGERGGRFSRRESSMSFRAPRRIQRDYTAGLWPPWRAGGRLSAGRIRVAVPQAWYGLSAGWRTKRACTAWR